MDGSSLRQGAARSADKPQTRFVYPIVAAAAALVAIGFGLVGYMAYTTARDTLARQIDTEISLTGQSAADGIEKWLSGRIALVQGMADNIAALPHDGLKSLLTRPTMTGTFTETYLGEANGVMTLASGIKLPDGYDPRQRDWYKAAAAAGHLVLTKPYASASDGTVVMTIATPVTKDNALSGVAAVDLDLGKVLAFLQSFKLEGR